MRGMFNFGTLGEMNMWSELPFDMLCIISEALTIVDFVSFSLVCSSWHDVYTMNKHNRTEAPWLMYSGGEREPKAVNCYSISDKKVLKIHSQPGSSFHDRICLGSAHGWLITADERSELSLLNPMTKQQFDLPPVSSFGYFVPAEYDLDGNISSYVYTDYQGYDMPSTSKEVRNDFYIKATLTHSPDLRDDYAVVILLFHVSRVAFARCGDKEWTTLACKNGRVDISCHDGVVYSIIWSGEVESWDFTQNISLPEPVTYVPRDMQLTGTDVPDFFYLVPTPWGDMLYIRRMKDSDYTTTLGVFKVDPQSKELIPLKNIGDYVIFIGGNQPICMSCKHHPNLKRNSVYFADEFNGGSHSKEYRESTRDIGIYHLKDGNIERGLEHSLLTWPPPIWFQPALV